MATKPAHVKIALKEGAQAGFEHYIESIERVTNGGTGGLPPVQEALAEIRKVGGFKKRTGEFSKPEKALKFYCAKYGIDPDAVPAKAKRTGTTRKAASGVPAPSAPDTGPNAGVADKLRKLLAAGIDIDDALEMIGMVAGDAEVEDDDDTEVAVSAKENDPFAPSERIADEPATNGRLWKLNSLGLLRIADDDEGDPITNIEAHEVIASILS